GSHDKSVRLWDIRSVQQIQMFNGHTNRVWSVEYSPFVIKNSTGNSNVICSGSIDKTIRFWDIRSNKSELYVMKLDEGIIYLKFIEIKNKQTNNEQKSNDDSCINLCYGSKNGLIRVWG
ncbi:WD-40 repeat-containing protein, partial [Reticulomyxa filosa]